MENLTIPESIRPEFEQVAKNLAAKGMSASEFKKKAPFIIQDLIKAKISSIQKNIADLDTQSELVKATSNMPSWIKERTPVDKITHPEIEKAAELLPKKFHNIKEVKPPTLKQNIVGGFENTMKSAMNQFPFNQIQKVVPTGANQPPLNDILNNAQLPPMNPFVEGATNVAGAIGGSTPAFLAGQGATETLLSKIPGFTKLLPFTQKLASSEVLGAGIGVGDYALNEPNKTLKGLGENIIKNAGLLGAMDIGGAALGKVKSALTDVNIKYPTETVTRYDLMKPNQPILVERVPLDTAAQFKILEAAEVPKSMYPQILESDKFKFMETFGQNIARKIVKDMPISDNEKNSLKEYFGIQIPKKEAIIPTFPSKTIDISHPSIDTPTSDMAIKDVVMDMKVKPEDTSGWSGGYKEPPAKITLKLKEPPSLDWIKRLKKPVEWKRYSFFSDKALVEKEGGDAGKVFMDKFNEVDNFHRQQTSRKIFPMERYSKSARLTDADWETVGSYRKAAEELTNKGLNDMQATALVNAQTDEILTKMNESGRGIINPQYVEMAKQRLKQYIMGKNLTKEQAEFYLTSQGVTLTPRQQRLNNMIGESMLATARDARNAEIKVIVGNKRFDIPENFYYNPMRFKTGILEDEVKYNALLDKIVRSGKAKTKEEAAVLFNQLQDFATKVRNPNLEKPRWIDWKDVEGMTLPFKESTYTYINNAYKRISIAKEFGAENQVADILMAQMARHGLSPEYTRQVYDYFTGVDRRTSLGGVFDNWIVPFTVITKMPFSALSQFNQRHINNWIAGGMENSLKAMVEIKRNYGGLTKEAEHAGALYFDLVNDINKFMANDSDSFLSKLSRKSLDWYQFNGAEKNNWIFSFAVGKGVLKDMQARLEKNIGDKYARFKVEKYFNLDPDKIAKGLTQEDIEYGVLQYAKKTQFEKVDYKVPYHWTHDAGTRLLTIFKGFSFRQTQLMYDVLSNELKHRNLKPIIIGFGIAPLTMGEVRNKIIREIKGIQDGETYSADKHPYLARYLNDIASAGTLGWFSNAWWAINRQSGLQSEFTGAAVGDAQTAIWGLWELAQGKPDTLGRQLLKSVPILGSRLQHSLLPTDKQLKLQNKNKPIHIGY